VLRLHVCGDAREEADRIAMLRLVDELARPFSRDEGSAHFTASAFVVDETHAQTCLVEHVKLGGLLQPGGHLDVRYLLVGRGEPAAGAGWYPLGEAGDASVARMVAKVRILATA
jgi:hypothetical protein